VYYKKLKEALNKRGGEEMSQEKIEGMITTIKKERKELREQIESYQRDFEQNNNRRIRYVRDIAPIDSQYRRYKELKVDLQRYEEMLNR
jgi:chromosome segregation ATPase